MTDPRRDDYRVECAAAARRGVIQLKWPTSVSLFVSNLNDNVNERLLREELSSCGPVASLRIPTLHARSLGLARVELPPGVKPDRFVKEFHGRELLGQRLNVVVDQRAKKFEEALKSCKSPKKKETPKEVPTPSPKKRARVSDSPTYSPASPALPVSDSDAPTPSKPKRPRCSSGTSFPSRREGEPPAGDRYHHTRRSHGEPPFFQDQRDSHRDQEPHRQSYRDNPRSFDNRDYGARYQEGRDRYDHRSGDFHNRDHFPPPSSRHHSRNEDPRDHPPHHRRDRDRYDEHRRHDRRDRSYGTGYADYDRLSPRRHDFEYVRDYSSGQGCPTESGSRNMHENISRHDKPIGGSVWIDDTRPAITLQNVPRRTTAHDLLSHFHYFRPKYTTTYGRGQWTMWFDEVDDRDHAFTRAKLFFHNRHLTIEKSTHVVGRKSVSVGAPSEPPRRDGYSRDFEENNKGSGAGCSVVDGSGARESHHRGKRYTPSDENYDGRRQDSNAERQMSERPSTLRGAYDSARDRTHSHDHATDVAHKDVHRRSNPAGEKAGAYNRNERHHDDERRRSHRDNFTDRRGQNESRQHEGRLDGERPMTNDAASSHPEEARYKREALADERRSTRKFSWDARMPDVGSTSGPPKDVSRTPPNSDVREKTAIVKATLKTDPGDRGTDLTVNDTTDKGGSAPKASEEAPQDRASPETRKKLTMEEIADIVAKQVYETAKEAIAIKGAVVQKSLVVQSVMKFVKSRRDRESREKARAKQAALAKKRADTTDKDGAASSSALKTAHLDLVETFLKPGKLMPKKPPLPDRHIQTPTKNRLRKSRFSDNHCIESEQEMKPDASVVEHEEPNSPDGSRGSATVKRRRLVLPRSPGSPEPGRASPEESRPHSVESLTSSELFREKELKPRSGEDENKETEASCTLQAPVLPIQKVQVRHAKASSLKLSSPSTGEGSIPHLLLTTRQPPSPGGSGPAGSAFTTSEDSASQGPSKPSGITKKAALRKAKTGSKSKKQRSRAHVQLSRKQSESTTDDEQYAGLLLSLKDSGSAEPRGSVEVLQGPVIFDDCDRQDSEVEEKDKETAENVDIEQHDTIEVELEPPERVGKCARTDIYVRSEHVGQHRQRNVHSRTSTSTQSSRECRQENRIYRKGVSHINPKNDIITLNHLKQRRKSVSFGQSLIHGMGLFAKENIDAGEFIIEYVGDLIRRVVADLREKKYVRQGMGDSYLFRLAGDWVIDATRRGGIARFINHSCDPNVIAKIISVVGEPKIVFYSKRTIKEGEELTYDYKFDFEGEDQKIACLCQAPSCRKYLN